MSDEKSFKRANKPAACTSQPWKYLIPSDQRDDVLRKIKEETIQHYGYSMDECTKRKTCFTKTCMGRELPFLSETARPYLEKLKTTHNIKNNELYIKNCEDCPIIKTCTSTCGQVNDWINRASDPETPLVYQENLENYNQDVAQASGERPKTEEFELPWDILNNQKAKVVKKYLYEQKDFLAVAKELDLNNQAEAKYSYYAAITKLSEWAVMRRFLNLNEDKLTETQKNILTEAYINNKELTEIAAQNDVTVAAVSQTINRVVKKFNISWPVFVKKEGNKVIYNVPEIFK